MTKTTSLLSIVAISFIFSGCSTTSSDTLPVDSSDKNTTNVEPTPTPVPSATPSTDANTTAESNATDTNATVESNATVVDDKIISYTLEFEDQHIEGDIKYHDGELQDKQKIEEFLTLIGSIKNGKYKVEFEVYDENDSTSPAPTQEPEDTQTVQPLVKKTGVTTSVYELDDGEFQSGQKREYEISRGIVTDKVTGLKWYNPEEFGTREDAERVCSSLGVDNEKWRVPYIKELQTLARYDKIYLSMDDELRVLLDDTDNTNVWGYEYRVDTKESAYYMNFGVGVIENQINSNRYHILCVSGYDKTEGKYIEHKEGYKEDASRKLMWEDTSDNSVYLVYSSAVNHCKELSLGGYTDWRLPNVNELVTITDFTKSTNINYVFDHLPRYGLGVWSSTPYSPNTDDVYTAMESNGNMKHRERTSKRYFRCVRTVK